MSNEYKKERIFPILRKLDYVWSLTPDRPFCEIWKDLFNGEFKEVTDEELQEKLKSIDIK